MTDSQYQELVEFLAERFTIMDQGFDALERRTAAVEVSLEAVRDDVRGVADGVLTNSGRLDRVGETLAGFTHRFDHFEVVTLARFDRLDLAVDAMGSDFGARLNALEKSQS